MQHLLTDILSTLAYLKTDYQKKLNMIKSFVIQAAKATVSKNFETHARYQYLLNSEISELLNDASLCIREIHLWKEATHPDDLSENDIESIKNAATTTIEFLIGLTKALNIKLALALNEHVRSRGFYNEQDMSSAVQHHGRDCWLGSYKLPRLFHGFLEKLNSSFIFVKRESDYVYHDYHLHQWCELFLGLAERIEILLADLYSGLGQQGNLSHEGELTDAFTGLAIR